jgi:hypothetical protein
VRGGEPPLREALSLAATWFLSLLKKPTMDDFGLQIMEWLR